MQRGEGFRLKEKKTGGREETGDHGRGTKAA